MINEAREFVEELRKDWKDLWQSRVDDKVRAEGIANKDYAKLFVERGTIIMATRDFKPLDFFDIVQLYFDCDAEKMVPPNPTVGGWGKFIKTHIKNQKKTRTRRFIPTKQSSRRGQQLKKGGRGWLHISLR